MQPHDSIPYNPDIANVFFRAGYIETWGQGIQKICDECIALGAELPRYEIIRSKPDITLDQLSAEVGIARRTLVRYMSALKEAGRIERVGGKRYGHWEIRDDMK